MGSRVKIVHIINELNTGGAEMMLYKLLSGLDKTRYNPAVISLMDIGPVGDEIKKLGVEIMCLNMKPGTPDPAKVLHLSRILRNIKPDIIQTWLWHSDLLGAIASKMTGRTVPIIWGIRITDLEHQHIKLSSSIVAQACARLSKSAWGPTKIVCCSNVAMHDHIRKGYDSGKMLIINNGFDVTLFKPNRDAGNIIRREFGIPEKKILIGMAARFHPQKDHLNFIDAAGLLSKKYPDTFFLLCGDNVVWNNSKLTSRIEKAGLKNNFRLLGLRKDMPRVLASLDIGALSSCGGEAFPNVLGETMSCGVPCVATDIGDSSMIVSDTGVIVPPNNPDALAAGWSKLIELGDIKRQKLGAAARERVINNYSLELAVERYEKLYNDIITGNKSKNS
jgi:glycosyltransferase involved in cell wall biosynthesis